MKPLAEKTRAELIREIYDTRELLELYASDLRAARAMAEQWYKMYEALKAKSDDMSKTGEVVS